MAASFNDSPINDFADDKYGVGPFAKALAKSLANIKDPVGTTIALHGPWGSGKSSTVNLVRKALNDQSNGKLAVTEFKPWWFRGEDALTLAFFQHLDAVLEKDLGDRIKGLVPKVAKRVLHAGSVVGAATVFITGAPVGGIISKVSSYFGSFFVDKTTVEEAFSTLTKALKEQQKRFLVIIDDIDRLTPDEQIAIFRLIKSVGHLPNVIYLLVFDRQLAEKIVAEKYPSEGPHFLEKIIQAGFELPSPIQSDLNDAVLASVSSICGSPDESEIQRFMNIFYDVVVPYITTPRHVTRFQNTISVTWPAIKDEVNLADFVALETIRLYEASLFNAIRHRKDEVCGTRGQHDEGQDRNKRFDTFIQGVTEGRQELAKIALQRLFPKLEDMGYGGEWINEWSVARRICVESFFDTYFRLSLSDEALSSQKIEELIERAGDKVFIQDALNKAAQTERKRGRSMVPVYLDALTTHAARIEKNKVETLISSLFEIHDDIDLEKDADRGFMAIANTSLRYHWLIRRLTEGRFSLEERTELYLTATKNAALGWLVDFVSSARDDYVERENKPPTREEDCLVSKGALDEMTERAIGAITATADDRSLLQHQDLARILYRWRDFLNNDPAKARKWTGSVLEDDQAVVLLARAFTSQTWSMGMGGFGGLGDRVAVPSANVQIKDDTDIIDACAFRAALERIRDEAAIDKEFLDVVRIFLEAWDRKKRGDD